MRRFAAGDLISFNNHRFLHARNEYRINGGQRHLQVSGRTYMYDNHSVCVYACVYDVHACMPAWCVVYVYHKSLL